MVLVGFWNKLLEAFSDIFELRNFGMEHPVKRGKGEQNRESCWWTFVGKRTALMSFDTILHSFESRKRGLILNNFWNLEVNLVTTDMARLICNLHTLNDTPCGYFRILLSLRFYVKSFLENPEVLKLPFFEILWSLNVLFW